MTLLLELLAVAIAALGVVAAAALVPRARPAPRARREAGPAGRPDQLVSLERLVVSAAASTVQAHAYLRPLLAEISAHRLAARGRTLERMPEPEARELLGERLWELVRPDRPFPGDRTARGVATADLARMLDALERL